MGKACHDDESANSKHVFQGPVCCWPWWVLLGCGRSPEATNGKGPPFPRLVVLYVPCTVNKKFSLSVQQ